MSLALHINKSDSHCECSGKNVDPFATTCPHCGGIWDTVTSDYAGGGIERAVAAMRPDLEPHFPFADFWQSEEGQRTLSELRTELQMDERQGDIDDEA